MSTAIRPGSRPRRVPLADPRPTPPASADPDAGLTVEQCRALRAVYDLILSHAQPAGTP